MSTLLLATHRLKNNTVLRAEKSLEHVKQRLNKITNAVKRLKNFTVVISFFTLRERKCQVICFEVIGQK